MDVRRVHPLENANEVAAGQVKLWAERPPKKREGVPLFVFDAGYDPVQLQQGLAGTRAAILVRLRAGRCFIRRTGRVARQNRSSAPPRAQAGVQGPGDLAGADSRARR